LGFVDFCRNGQGECGGDVIVEEGVDAWQLI